MNSGRRDRDRRRAWSRSGWLGALVAAVLAAGALAGCTAAPAGRPSTPATLQFVSPAANAVTGRDVDVRLRVDHAQVVSAPPRAALDPTQGHVHLSLDGQFIAMSYGLARRLTALAPGRHTLQAEFVATDHLPFRNRVVTAVTFTVT